MEMMVLTTMCYAAIKLFKKVLQWSDAFGAWFTAERGTGEGQNGWVGGEAIKRD